MDLIDAIDTRLLDLQSEMSKLQLMKEIEQRKQASQVELPFLKLSKKLQEKLDSLNSTLRSKLQMEVVVNHILGTLQLVQHCSDVSYTIAVYSETEVQAKMEKILGTATATAMSPIQYWFNDVSGLVNALSVLLELTGGNFYKFDLKYDFTNSLITFNFNQFQVVVTDFSSVSLGRVEVSKEVAGSRAMKFNLGSEGLVLDFSNSVNELITAKITVPCNFYSNSGVITKINEAMEKIESFLHSARIPV